MNNFKIPALIDKLVSAGIWPDENWSTAQFGRLETQPIIGREATHKVSPDDEKIVLMPVPFHTIADEVDGGNEFWTRHLTNYGEIDYHKAVIIADFGLGSDSPIILYYENNEEPKVMYLKWSFNNSKVEHAWVCTHDTFEAFAFDIGLLSKLEEYLAR